MNIVVVGFMGTGKTAVARLLATRLDLKYISTDEIIEDKERRSCNDVFHRSGESYFRAVEKEVVKKVSQLDKFVIDAGGGVVLDKENLANLKQRGKLICLEASVDVIIERTKRNRHRPLLNVKDPKAKIEELLTKRAPFYAKADFCINTTELTVENVVKEIIKKINEFSVQPEQHQENSH